MVNLSLAILPHITGAIHVMANPTLKSTDKFVECGQRKLVPTMRLRGGLAVADCK